MGRGGLMLDNLITGEDLFGSRRKGRRRKASSPYWEPLMGVTPTEAAVAIFAGNHIYGTDGLPPRFAKHAVLWWTTPQFDREGNLYSRFITAGRRRVETPEGVRYPTHFCCIQTIRKAGSERIKLARVDSHESDLERMVSIATRKVPGSRVWSVEQQLERMDDAAMMIAHRIGITELYGCDGVRAAIVNPSKVELDVEEHYPKAVYLRKKKSEWLAKQVGKGLDGAGRPLSESPVAAETVAIADSHSL